MCNDFLRSFQYDDPLVQALYAAVDDLVRTQELDNLDVREPKNWQPLHGIEIGEATKTSVVKNRKRSSMIGILNNVRNLYVKSVQCLQNNLPVTNTVLEDLQRLIQSDAVIQRLARTLPHVVSGSEISVLADEWNLYSVDKVPKDWYIMNLLQTPESDGCLNLSVIDCYWAKVLEIEVSSQAKCFASGSKSNLVSSQAQMLCFRKQKQLNFLSSANALLQEAEAT